MSNLISKIKLWNTSWFSVCASSIDNVVHVVCAWLRLPLWINIICICAECKLSIICVAPPPPSRTVILFKSSFMTCTLLVFWLQCVPKSLYCHNLSMNMTIGTVYVSPPSHCTFTEDYEYKPKFEFVKGATHVVSGVISCPL